MYQNIRKIKQTETIKAKTLTLCKIMTEGQDEGLKVCFETRESQYFKSLVEDSLEVRGRAVEGSGQSC